MADISEEAVYIPNNDIGSIVNLSVLEEVKELNDYKKQP